MQNSIFSKIKKIVAISFIVAISASANLLQDSSNQINLFPNVSGKAKIDSLNNYAFNLGTSNLKLRMEIGEKCFFLSKKSNYELGLAESLNNIGVSYFNTVRDTTAAIYLKKAFFYADKIKNYEWKTIIAINLGEVYSREHLFDLALAHYKKGMSSSVKSKDSVSRAKLFNLFGIAHWRKGSFKKALKYYKESLDIEKQLGNNQKVFKILNNIGSAYYQIGDYQLALEYYIEAKDIRKTFTNVAHSVLINNIGLVYLELNDTSTAYGYFKRGLIAANETNSTLGKGYTYFNLGDLNFRTKSYSTSLKFYNKSKPFYEKLNDINGVAKILNRMGRVYLKINNVNRAKDKFFDAYKISKDNGLKLTQTESLVNICKIQIINGNNNGAKVNLERAYKTAISNSFVNSELGIYKLQTAVYKNLNNYKIALMYHEKYDSLKSRLFNEHSLRIITETKEKYEADKKERFNRHLRNINDLQNIELENKKRNQFYITSASIFFFFVIIYLVYVNTQRKKKHKELLIAKKETEEINLKLNETNKLLEYSNSTKDKFFSIIAHDLKNPFNTLLGASQILNADDSELSEEDKKELIELISNDTKKLYSLLENLLFWARSQTGMLTAKKDSLNLKSIVSDNVQLYKSTAEKKNIIIEVDISENYIIQFDEFMFSTIMRNLLSNAIKFSYSDSKISIVAKDKNSSIILKIIDEGVGIKEEHLGKLFDESSEHKSKGTDNEKGTGLGLILCRNFADQNNATISVESQIDVGTTFIISLEKAD